MLNYYTILCLLALSAFIQTMPTNDTSSSEEINEENDKTHRIAREIEKKIDGAVHHIKSAGVSYTQRIIKDECFVEYDGKFLAESSVLKIRKKIFRVEACALERVYHACGPNLLLMLGIVCRFFEEEKRSNALVNFKREASLPVLNHLEPTTDRAKRVITESCCENFCSISELTRYCHE